jgi:polyprenyldihydroxybenzoate methyltransferase / 3-demethylubiquinol 3-O-methyltransferase
VETKILSSAQGPVLMVPRGSVVLRKSFNFSATFRPLHNPSTVNSQEIRHFDELASTWWDPNGSSGVLHRMNALRVGFIKEVLAPTSSSYSRKHLEGHSILDVGCGGGILTESLSRLGAQVEGIDASSRAIMAAQAHARNEPEFGKGTMPMYTCGLIHDLQTSQLYSAVTAMEVLEHVDYPAVFLDELVSKVKPGGWIILSTIARTWTAWVGSIVVAERILCVVPVGTHLWEKFIAENELRDYFHKLRDKRGSAWTAEMLVRWCGYNPLRGTWYFTDTWKPGVFNYFIAVRRASQ